jgi:CelD/BcsL family acetyltransferase involved in cellulose biosynthesis
VLVGALRAALAAGAADLVTVPPLALGSEPFRALDALGGPLERQAFIEPWSRRRLVLPGSFAEFVASRSPNTRWRIRREAKRLSETFGERLSVEIIRGPEGLERFVGAADRVARLTYQHALGAGFADTPEQRALAEVGLRHGWVRGYLLFLDGEPVAYWYCSTYAGTLLIRTTGFDHAHAEHRLGIHLLMRVIEDACADPSLELLDFGPGDAPYKQQFSSEAELERNLVVYAPTLRGRRLNALRSLILGSARLLRRSLDAAKLTERLRSRWRQRLRSPQRS